jgi:hypothetical protein
LGRISQWLARRKSFEPEGHVVSGRLAEYRLLKLTRAVSKDALVLEGIRFPDPEQGGRRELDMVIATKDEILFIEQKHWSGSFSITDEGKFLQKRKNGSFLEHKDIVAWTTRKGDIIAKIHKDRCGQDLPKAKTILVFSNSNLQWSAIPKGAETYDELGFIDMLDKKQKSAPDEQLKQTLEGFGTWDTIHLNGGKTLHGDILKYPFTKRDCSIRNSGLFGLIVGPKSKLSTGQIVIDLTGPHISVVGEEGSRTIPFAHISKIEFSNPKEEWG